MSSTRTDLTKFAWLSIAAALVTIALKTGAWLITGSVGLASDAAESVVNLVAVAFILTAVRTSGQFRSVLTAHVAAVCVYAVSAVVATDHAFETIRRLGDIGGVGVSLKLSLFNHIIGNNTMRCACGCKNQTITVDIFGQFCVRCHRSKFT